MTDAVSITRDGYQTWLKWHRARRRASDPVFTGARILEGMRLGASVEVDLVIHRDRGYAVLHDMSVERETTGQGRVVDLGADELRQLHLRGNDGQPIQDRVMLLEDLTALLAKGGLHPDALLQLDYKEDSKVLDAAAIASFKASVAPVASAMILSSGDAASVNLLTSGVPGLKIGYDPCHDGSLARLQVTRDYAGFVADALVASPKAEMIYLDYRMVLAVAADGYDMIAAFHTGGKRIDTYTIKVADDAALPDVLRLLDLKTDQITTDDPEGMVALLAGVGI
jgi:glycerophosphoryl diester phosphodiesterase